MSRTTHPNRADETNLSPSRSPDGSTAEAATIPTVSPHTNLCSDNAEEPANHSAIAPPARMSRRSLIVNSFVSAASVATATAIPNASLVASPAKSDPAFAAIEAHRSAMQMSEHARRLFCDAEREAMKQGCPTRPATTQVQVGEHAETNGSYVKDGSGGYTITMWRTGKMIPTYARFLEDIERAAPEGLEEPERQAWINEQTEKLARETARIAAEWKVTHLGQLEAAADEADDDAEDSLWDLIWTKPTTLNGLSVLLTYCVNSLADLLHGHEWRDVLDWTVACAASELGRLPAPPMSNIVAELWAAREADLTAEDLIA